MKLRKNSGKILWGLIFILAAVYVVISKIYTLPVVSVWSILGTILCIWIVFQGIKHVNFWEILFPIAFICMIYDEQLGITELTPYSVLGAALLGSIGLSMIFKKKGHGFSVSFDHDNGWPTICAGTDIEQFVAVSCDRYQCKVDFYDNDIVNLEATPLANGDNEYPNISISVTQYF